MRACACGHLPASHRAQGCVANVPCPGGASGTGHEVGPGCLVAHICPCREYREPPAGPCGACDSEPMMRGGSPARDSWHAAGHPVPAGS